MVKKPPRTAKRAAPAKPHVLDPTRLVHELEVHRAELESQNEELRSVRRDLEVALARYTELFDFAPIGYAAIDKHGVIRQLNHAGARVLGSPRARLAGTPFPALLTREDHVAFDAMSERVRTTGLPADCELRVRQAVLHVHATPQPHDASCLLLALEDITQRKAEREQLASSLRALRESSRRKDEFIAMLSHELRNPLAPIRTSLDVLAKELTASDTAAEAREIAERQIAHLTRIVDDLLDVTRISSGKIRLQRERVDLVQLVMRAIADHRAGFAASEIGLGTSCDPGPLWVDVDPARIVQVVSNLLGNAQKFTPRGGRVAVVLQQRGLCVELRLRDTGVGIPAELLPYVCEPFTQAPQTIDRSRGGLGLGLAMVKGLVDLHGGSIRIESAGVGRGTEIAISLPITTPGATAVAPVVPLLTSRRVLVIEDQADAARILETALTMLGLDVRVAGSGKAGLEIARAFRPEVVLCDLGLPEMDGYEVARAFRRDRELCDTYLVALSGYAQPEDLARTNAAGFSRHLAKPASLDTLLQVIVQAP